MTLPNYSRAFANQVIELAWQDRVSFERIEELTGWEERRVIALMRRELKPGSFRRWRRRVSGRATKHRRRQRERSLEPRAGDPGAAGET